jgi:hypothetical protein
MGGRAHGIYLELERPTAVQTVDTEVMIHNISASMILYKFIR